MAPLLSICIPTYNRGRFLGETLASISEQITPDIEVVISDNASDDETHEVVQRFRSRIPRLVYSRNGTNQGFSRNFMRAVELSSGRYAWLLGSDDVVRAGMVARVLEELDSGYTVYLFDRLEWDADTNEQRLDATLDARVRPSRFRLSDRRALLRYLHAARTITAMFSFISSVVFRRTAWDRVPFPSHWHDCAFPHAIRLFGMLGSGGELLIVREPLVLSRLMNDTFNPEGKYTIRRLLMDFHGYHMIIAEYWAGDRAVGAAARAVMRRTHPTTDVLKFRRIVRPDEVAELCESLREFGYGRVFVSLYRTEVCRRLVVWLKQLYQRLGLSA
jgi:abequosyltransferase